MVAGWSRTKSTLKNASVKRIINKLYSLKFERFRFDELLLQGDTFWLYCGARKYWGSYSAALRAVRIEIDGNVVKSEKGQKIDWWPYAGGADHREHLALILRNLEKECVDISPFWLKNSPYFDLYTDAVNLFGKFDLAKKYAGLEEKRTPRSLIRYPKSRDMFEREIATYVQAPKKRISISSTTAPRNRDGVKEGVSLNEPTFAVVDATNVVYRENTPNLDDLRIIDNYLQTELGVPKQSIRIVLDHSFRRSEYIQRTELDHLLHADDRYSVVPRGKSIENRVLSICMDLHDQNVDSTPLLVSNGDYTGYLDVSPQFKNLGAYKRGVTWTYIDKTPTPLLGQFTSDVVDACFEMERECQEDIASSRDDTGKEELVTKEFRSIFRLERSLRALVVRALKESYGESWYDRGIPPEIRQSIESVKKSDLASFPQRRREIESDPGRLLEFTQIRDFVDILIFGENWKKFQSAFQSRTKTEERAKILQEYRNSVAHGRTIDQIALVDGRNTIRWFEECISLM